MPHRFIFLSLPISFLKLAEAVLFADVEHGARSHGVTS